MAHAMAPACSCKSLAKAPRLPLGGCHRKPYYLRRGIQGSSTAVYSGGKPMSAITTRLIIHNSWSLYDFVRSHGPWKERWPSRSFDKQLLSGILVSSTLQSWPRSFLLRLCVDGASEILVVHRVLSRAA